MTHIYLVRHGQTEWNRQERFRGRIDIPLNKVGHAQAEAIAAYLNGEAIAAVYTSPLRRAVQTAQPTAQAHDLAPTILPGLIDISYGEWQGHSPSEVRDKFPDLLELWYTEPHRVDIPGGQNLKTVKEQAMAALHETLSRHDNGGIVLVTHQIVIKVLTCTLLGLEVGHIWRIRQDNACIDVFDWDKRQFTAILVNGTDHLRDIGNVALPA